MVAITLYSIIYKLFWKTIEFFRANSRENADRLRVILVVHSDCHLHMIRIYMSVPSVYGDFCGFLTNGALFKPHKAFGRLFRSTADDPQVGSLWSTEMQNLVAEY